jgi:hypothetical protein
MKRTLATAILLCGFLSGSFAEIGFNLEAPQDDLLARDAVSHRPELKPLETALSEICQTCLLPRNSAEIAKIFGPALYSATNWWADSRDSAGNPTESRRPKLDKYPADIVLPLFIPVEQGVSGLQLSNKNHTDLHLIGDLAYAEFYYKSDGETPMMVVLYFRADDKFVPLKSANDFPERVAWEKTKMNALAKWFDDRVPKPIDLGIVEVSETGPCRVNLGGGTACVLNAVVVGSSTESNRLLKTDYVLEVEKETTNTLERVASQRYESFHPGQPVGFSLDGKFYKLKPKIVE